VATSSFEQAIASEETFGGAVGVDEGAPDGSGGAAAARSVAPRTAEPLDDADGAASADAARTLAAGRVAEPPGAAGLTAPEDTARVLATVEAAGAPVEPELGGPGAGAGPDMD
jgi:hypothetical protein